LGGKKEVNLPWKDKRTPPPLHTSNIDLTHLRLAWVKVNDEGLWWPAKIVAETEVPPEILKPFLPVHGKIVHLFHSEKNLQPYQVVKRRFVCTKNLQFKSHHACHFDLETTVTGEEEDHCKISSLSAEMIVFWLKPHRNPSEKAPTSRFFLL
jgi:hypothetical protein